MSKKLGKFTQPLANFTPNEVEQNDAIAREKFFNTRKTVHNFSHIFLSKYISERMHEWRRKQSQNNWSEF